MLLIVGLGNPGPKYETTRHNIGFMVVDKVVKDMDIAGETWQKNDEFKSHIFKKGDLVFAKPQTFMNASGVAVRKLAKFYKVEQKNIWVIHDDIDLTLGKIRIKIGGGSAGHHGIESIHREVGEGDFVRFRMGVGRGQDPKRSSLGAIRHRIEKFVVSAFTIHEEAEVRKMVKHGAKAVQLALNKGLDRAMNEYN